MKQILTIFLNGDENIDQIRKKYVPNYKKFKPHITLVYPFEYKNHNMLKEHIFQSIKNFKSFEISLNNLKKSTKGYYLYLPVNKGKEKIISLHKKLNGGILNNFRNQDMPKYIPHLSIGIFKTKKEREKAINEISKRNINFETKVNSIQLLKIDENHFLKYKENFYF